MSNENDIVENSDDNNENEASKDDSTENQEGTEEVEAVEKEDQPDLVENPPSFDTHIGFRKMVGEFHNLHRWAYQGYVNVCIWFISIGTFLGVCFAKHPHQDRRFLEDINWWELSILGAAFILGSWFLFSFQGVKHSRKTGSLGMVNFLFSTAVILVGAYGYGHFVIPAFITPDFGFFIGFVIVSPMLSQILYQKHRNQYTMMMSCTLGLAHIYHLVQIFPNFAAWLTGAA